MYFSKMRPDTACLYSAAYIEPRSALAAAHGSDSYAVVTPLPACLFVIVAAAAIIALDWTTRRPGSLASHEQDTTSAVPPYTSGTRVVVRAPCRLPRDRCYLMESRAGSWSGRTRPRPSRSSLPSRRSRWRGGTAAAMRKPSEAASADAAGLTVRVAEARRLRTLRGLIEPRSPRWGRDAPLCCKYVGLLGRLQCPGRIRRPVPDPPHTKGFRVLPVAEEGVLAC